MSFLDFHSHKVVTAKITLLLFCRLPPLNPLIPTSNHSTKGRLWVLWSLLGNTYSQTWMASGQSRNICSVDSTLSAQILHLLHSVKPRFALFILVISLYCLTNQRKVWMQLGIFSFQILLQPLEPLESDVFVISEYAEEIENSLVFSSPHPSISSCSSPSINVTATSLSISFTGKMLENFWKSHPTNSI